MLVHAGVISLLFAVSAISCFVLAPVVGKIIDRIGYKTVMIADTLLLVVVCFFYGFAHHLFSMHTAFVICCINYDMDSERAVATRLAVLERCREEHLWLGGMHLPEGLMKAE